MTKNEENKKKAEENKRNIHLTRFAASALGLLVLCSNLSAQEKENKKQKDGKEGIKTEAKVGFSNVAGIKIEKDKAIFYDDGVPTLSLSAEYDGWHANAMFGELNIYSNGQITPVNNNANVTIGKTFKNGVDISAFLGRAPFQGAEVFFNGVPKLDYWTDAQGFGVFGAPSKQINLSVKIGNHKFSAGTICGLNDGSIYLFPSKEAMDYFVRYSGSIQKDDAKFGLDAAAQFGKNHRRVYANANYKKGQFSVAGGGNYDVETKVLNAYLRGALQSSQTDLTYILQTVKTGDTFAVHLAVGKNGIQGFVGVENISLTQQQAPEFKQTPTISAGVSYSFSTSKTF